MNANTDDDAPAAAEYAYQFPAWTGIPDFDGQQLCAQVDPEPFFPEKGGDHRPAKAICARCPVRHDCLEWAMAHAETFGIWGGLSPRERRDLRRTRRTA